MNNNEWITDRRPHRDDGPYVYRADGAVRYYTEIPRGEIWKPIPKCEPYVMPKRFIVLVSSNGTFEVFKASEPNLLTLYASGIPTLAAAERIAAIYEEMMP